jgi:hypothetical protein
LPALAPAALAPQEQQQSGSCMQQLLTQDLLQAPDTCVAAGYEQLTEDGATLCPARRQSA